MLSFQVLMVAVLCVRGQGDRGHRTLPNYPQTLALLCLRPASRVAGVKELCTF